MDDKGATFLCDLVRQAGAAMPESTGTPYLIVVRGALPGAMISLTGGRQAIGRAPENEINLREVSVSRYHAAIEADADGLPWLTDLGSTNGTARNGERLVPHQPVPLADGDRLAFGPEIALKFVRPDPHEERFQREMFERTVRDPLTGLYNRRYFLDRIDDLSRQAAGRRLGLAVWLLDVDHFKRVNDTFGHATGDAVLREVAAVLRLATRSDDLVARYGGEEFVAALPIAAPDQATERAERVRRSLAARRIAVAGRTIRVTASIGLAFTPAGRSRPAASLIATADACLYQAKRNGRDRVVCRPEPLARPELPMTTVDDGSAERSEAHP